MATAISLPFRCLTLPAGFPDSPLTAHNQSGQTTNMKSYFIPVLALGLLVSSASAQDKPDLTNPKQKTSYAIGLSIATSLKRQDIDVDVKALHAGIADGFAGKPALTDEEQRAVIMDLQKSAMSKMEEKQQGRRSDQSQGR